ncbi:hypothetical protein Z517_03956 [Fonsecaea pedrosoi CBS 271.37]|uniref:carnosine N-methyltransferase n=1 Tax=Fonsecaea pedrosoi CBS 271.37 TaxID=1442368 RepID=A0A0D2GJE9_9EURO|nr:uncharacterized protein Z517_03956 [Fonsecaea pedrosoi CBS 271.37]KIW80933.1 hypothetical protein Z517_03956 [Fonsecaea pedrosoi CBS 271.37]
MATVQNTQDAPLPQPSPLFDDAGPLADPQERRVIFAALDSFRWQGRMCWVVVRTGLDDRLLQLHEDEVQGVIYAKEQPASQALSMLLFWLFYRINSHFNTTHRRRQNFYALPSAQWQMLAVPPFSIRDTLSAVDDAIDHNADLAEQIFLLGLSAFALPEKPPKDSEMNWQGKAKPNDMAKAHSTIRQFYRDWSHEGFTREVEPLLSMIISDLAAHLSTTRTESQPPSLLLPGAGLGRVLFELALRGFHATGNEISYHQLFASNFILNSTERADQYSIYPFAHTFTNVESRANQLRCFTIPDIHPGQAFSARLAAGSTVGEMNMTAGDFVLSYSTPESRETFDGLVSLFFIDTAPNLIRYIETVRNCLKVDGVWINIGPLLWHFDNRVPGGNTDEDEDGDDGQPAEAGTKTQPKPDLEDKGIGEPGSVELTDEEVVQLVSHLGFEVLSHEILPVDSGYVQDPNSLLQNRYRCSHWVARKL